MSSSASISTSSISSAPTSVSSNHSDIVGNLLGSNSSSNQIFIIISGLLIVACLAAICSFPYFYRRSQIKKLAKPTQRKTPSQLHFAFENRDNQYSHDSSNPHLEYHDYSLKNHKSLFRQISVPSRPASSIGANV